MRKLFNLDLPFQEVAPIEAEGLDLYLVEKDGDFFLGTSKEDEQLICAFFILYNDVEELAEEILDEMKQIHVGELQSEQYGLEQFGYVRLYRETTEFFNEHGTLEISIPTKQMISIIRKVLEIVPEDVKNLV